jgi:hypothetical protein
MIGRPAGKLQTRSPIGICEPSYVRDQPRQNWSMNQRPVCDMLVQSEPFVPERYVWWTARHLQLAFKQFSSSLYCSDTCNPATARWQHLCATLAVNCSCVAMYAQPQRPGICGRGITFIRVLMATTFCFKIKLDWTWHDMTVTQPRLQ